MDFTGSATQASGCIRYGFATRTFQSWISWPAWRVSGCASAGAIGTANRTHPEAGRMCPCGGSCPSSNTGRGIGCVLRREEDKMPLVTVFNLRRDDPLADLEE